MVRPPEEIIAGRSLPHSVDIERAILGIILLDNSTLHQALEHLKRDDFYHDTNRRIFEKMVALYEKDQPIDPITLQEELQRAGELEQIGGVSYIASLIDGTPHLRNIEHYAKIVRDKSLLRRLINISNHIVSECFEQEEESDIILDKAERAILEIADDRAKQGFVIVGEVAKQQLEVVEKMAGRPQMITGLPTGFVDFDQITAGLQQSDLIIIAARPSVGKTSLVLSIAQNAAQAGYIVGISSLEMSKEQLVIRLLCSEAKLNMHKFRGGFLNRDEWSALANGLQRLAACKIFIDDAPGITTLELRAKARRLKHEKGLDLLIVDYLQLMSGRGRSESRQQEVSRISRELKMIAKDLTVPLIAVSQLSRAPESRTDHRPQLSDLRESGCLTGDTLIMRADTGQLMSLRELAREDRPLPVLSMDSDLRLRVMDMTRVFRSGVKKVYRLGTRSGRTIEASANHPFRTLRGWQRLDQLRAGDHIATPRRLSPAPSEASEIEPDRLLVLAHLMGAGCYVRRQPLHHTNSGPMGLRAVSGAAKPTLGIDPRRVRRKNRYQVDLSTGQGLAPGRRHPIAQWLDGMGIYGQRSREKGIPSVVFRLPLGQLALFLGHLWAIDGAIGRSPRGNGCVLYYSTSSQRLVRQLQHLLLRFSIRSRIGKRKRQKAHQAPNYRLHIRGATDQLQFLTQIGIHGAKAHKLSQAIETLRRLPPDPNIDPIPKAVGAEMDRARQLQGLTWPAFAQKLSLSTCGSTLFKQGVSRERMGRMASFLSDSLLSNPATSDIYWDEIVHIEPCGEEEVFDATVPGTHSFIANDIIVHNSIEQDADVVGFLFREEMYNPAPENEGRAQLILAKQRNGPTGTIELAFLKEFTRFENLMAGSSYELED